ncbi:hypothetical protein [Microcoleus sp. Pol12B4]|uniref:hypothetical protein n=1 Tax=Microcoleus sp. Pol12B4 TaxID=3055395 RepID=UPI002FD6ADE4
MQEILPRTSEECLPPRGQGGATQTKAQQPFEFQVRSIMRVVKVSRMFRLQRAIV